MGFQNHVAFWKRNHPRTDREGHVSSSSSRILRSYPYLPVEFREEALRDEGELLP